MHYQTKAKNVAASLAMQSPPTPSAPAERSESGPRGSHSPWTTRDSAELTRLYAAGHNTLAIAVTMGRSETTIKRWSLRLKLRAPTSKRPWSDEDKAALHHGIQAGIGLRTIALTLGRTYGAVQVYVAAMIKTAAEHRAPQATAPLVAPVRADPIIPGRRDDLYTVWLGAMRAQAARYPSHAG